uniref:Uncharacterized protein n=1 Tax=Anopheles darlingi TaxID=43151 RepID=A0A2M4DQ67_ANODA
MRQSIFQFPSISPFLTILFCCKSNAWTKMSLPFATPTRIQEKKLSSHTFFHRSVAQESVGLERSPRQTQASTRHDVTRNPSESP